MKNLLNICILVICMIGLFSCRGNSGQKAVQMAKKYIGKTVNTTKKLHLENHADDVTRIKFVKVRCKKCNGTGKFAINKCSECEGDGWVYRVERRY